MKRFEQYSYYCVIYVATKVILPEPKTSVAKSDDENNPSQDNEDPTENPDPESPLPPKKTKKGRLSFR